MPPGEESSLTELHAEAVELNIGLSTNFVAVETTFITMSNHKTMFIENRSNVTAHFQWKAFPTEEGENREKRRQCRFLRPWSEKSQENLTEEETSESEMGSCEDHTARLSNTVLAEIAKVQQDPMLFSDDIFFIEPVEGEIGPNSSAEIKVTFKPTEALEYRSVAYCNISGCESRLPLRLRGHGKGPLVELNCRTLNLGNVSVNTPHVREVQLVNLGAIDAPFTYISSNANVGFCFKFAPKEGIIAPGGTQTIQVSFGATVLGTFEEEFQFSVAGSPRPAILTIKGSVTGPTSLSDTIKLNLEDISSDSPNTKTCCLTDTSPVFHDGLWRKNCFPNLQIQPSMLEFVGGTEEVRSLEMTNCSPLLAKYHWSLCSDSRADKLGSCSLLLAFLPCTVLQDAQKVPTPEKSYLVPGLMLNVC
ncbi:hydrocephalus-inducing protein homolog [Taeniopygia guttata]|uniref:hydrocephalus-inducing protein homolog n=1 Tax=Taeniopygia guttata TaxID=59729 RepID=UPI003BB99871